MQCEKERIIQVSLTKITDSRRRRGGPTLRRNLLVSHVLNNVLTKADTAYQEYRTTVEIDMEVETWDQDEQKPKVLRENESTGGSIATPTGNRTESPHSLCSVGNSTELSRVCFVENGPVSEDKAVKDICSDSRVKESDCSKNERTPQIHETPVTSNKRPRYANEPCDYHVVCSKRFRFESSTESGTSGCDFHEPMDISSLVTVFSSSFAGLSGLTGASNSTFEPFQCLDSISPLAAFPQTVEAF